MKYAAGLALVMALAISTGALANVVHFGGFSGEFTDPSLWWDPTSGTNHAPGSSDTALFYTGAVCTVGASTNVTINQLYLGEWCQSGLPHNSVSSMVIDGSITSSTISAVGCLSGASPTMRGLMTINTGGSFINSQGMILGAGNNGTVIMNGGTLYSEWGIGLGCNPWGSDNRGVGMINLNSGLVETNQLIYESDASQVIMSGGTLKIWTYSQGIAGMNSGHIVAAAGKSLVYHSYAAPYGLTGIEITVVPEPATMALLGLGGLFFARRRK